MNLLAANIKGKKLSVYFQRIDVDNKMNLNFHYQDIEKTQKTKHPNDQYNINC